MSEINVVKVQEVYFDLCDILNSCKHQLAEIQIEDFQEFENLLEFLEEQKTKLEEAGV